LDGASADVMHDYGAEDQFLQFRGNLKVFLCKVKDSSGVGHPKIVSLQVWFCMLKHGFVVHSSSAIHYLRQHIFYLVPTLNLAFQQVISEIGTHVDAVYSLL